MLPSCAGSSSGSPSRCHAKVYEGGKKSSFASVLSKLGLKGKKYETKIEKMSPAATHTDTRSLQTASRCEPMREKRDGVLFRYFRSVVVVGSKAAEAAEKCPSSLA